MPDNVNSRRVAVTGASGLIGAALCERLQTLGHDVVRVARSERGAYARDAVCVQLEGCDAVVHLAGSNVFGRWTPKKKRDIMDSRADGTRVIAEACVHARVPHLISASAIGYYGHQGAAVLSEGEPPGSDFLAAVCVAWEDATATAMAKPRGVAVAHVRLGMVLTPTGGVLKKMWTPFKLGLGGRLGNGRQMMSWVSLDDTIAALIFLLDDRALTGAFNVTAPNPVSNAEFTRTLARQLHRHAFVPVPAVVLKMIFGSFADEALLQGRAVVPHALQRAGFTFTDTTLSAALIRMM